MPSAAFISSTPCLAGLSTAEDAHTPEPLQRGFVYIMGGLGDALTRGPLYQVKTVYQMNIANFYYARRLAESQGMNHPYTTTQLHH